eukprot:scaffold19592_cov112-Isochrysis_galbana.AAC.1
MEKDRGCDRPTSWLSTISKLSTNPVPSLGVEEGCTGSAQGAARGAGAGCSDPVDPAVCGPTKRVVAGLF